MNFESLRTANTGGEWDILTKLPKKECDFGPTEDASREKMQLRELSREDFNAIERLSFQEISAAQEFIKESISKHRYDSFPLAERLAQDDIQTPDDLHKVDDEAIFLEQNNGETCAQMARNLQNFYTERGIKSNLVPFKNLGQVNQAGNKYNPYGHLGCIAPFKTGDQECFVLLDQGLALVNPVIFPAKKNSEPVTYGEKRYQVLYDTSDTDNPYSLVISKKPLGSEDFIETDRASFNPTREITNPKAFTREALRAIPGFRIAKYDKDGKAIASASVDYASNSYRLKDKGSNIALNIDFADEIDNYPEIVTKISDKLDIDKDALVRKLQTGGNLAQKMHHFIYPPSVRSEIESQQESNLELSQDRLNVVMNVLNDFKQGTLLYHEHPYNLTINLSNSNKKSSPSAFGETIPTMGNLFTAPVKNQLNRLFDLVKNKRDDCLWLQSRANQKIDQVEKDVFAQLWFNATNHDFENLDEYIKRECDFIEDHTFDDLLNKKEVIGILGDFDGNSLITEMIQQSGSNETPNMLNFLFLDDFGNQHKLPSVRYGISNNIAYIYAIQEQKTKNISAEDKKLGRKINRMLYKINKGVLQNESPEYQAYVEKRNAGNIDENEPYPENISDVSVSSVFSLVSTIKLLNDRQINQIRIPYFCPLRFQAHSRLGEDEQTRIQENVSNKFLRTFRRASFHLGTENNKIKYDTTGYIEFDFTDIKQPENQLLAKIFKNNQRI